MRFRLQWPLLSVNAKQLAQPAFQVGPNRCKSDHGCHALKVQIVLHAGLRSRKFVVQIHVRAPLSKAPCLSSYRASFVNSCCGRVQTLGASPTRGSIS